MLTFRDVAFRDGVCWRFIGDDAPDHRPNVNDINTPANPKTWDWWDPQAYDKQYLAEHGHKRVELLEHFTVNPTPTLLKGVVDTEEFEVVRTSRIKDGQWYLGPYDSQTYSQKVATALNTKKAKTKEYRRDYGPCGSDGFAVRRVEAPACKTPAAVVRSCVDPLDKLLNQWAGEYTGAECLARFEMAQRTESLVRTLHGYVCTNADCGLDEGQVALAQEIWPHMLRARFKLAANKERLRVVCDDVDEMPNMADA